jgi:transcriptional regulator with PAS, ATPase and Fis domain
MMEIFKKLQSIAQSDLNILLVGETGTGKDFLARMVHLSSKRKGAFVAVNCAAVPPDLVEAELFGIGEKVATNVNQRKGKIAAAADGTLFLDELAAFPHSLQPKVLRSIEDKSVSPVGENRSIPVDFRLISATNENPQELMENGRLREDLYHRLSTVEFYIPPLRERKEDLEVLIPAILKNIAEKENKRISAMSKRLFALLLEYSYPGNLRELTNILKAIVAFAHSGELLDIHLLPEKLVGRKGSDLTEFVESRLQEGNLDLRNTVDEFTKNFIVRALRRNGGNVTTAAKQLKITAFGLRKMMKRLGIPKETV